jgi:Zn-dependent protease/CBS domain-containing protein
MRTSIKLFRIFGIEIRVHISWLIIVVLVTLSLASHFSMVQHNWSPAVRWSASVLTAMLFFASMVAHELSHSLTAKHYGISVRSITLFLFGGVSEIEDEAKHPREEFWIAIVGPLMSFFIAGLSGAITLMLGSKTFIGSIAAWLSGINLMLAIFNMLPGFPLDGGRVLRGLVWWKTGDIMQATRIASSVGEWFAMLMIGTGIWFVLKPGQDLGGLWLIFLGWFLLDAARKSRDQIEVENALVGVTALDLVASNIPRVMADLPLSQFASEYMLRTEQHFFAVTDGIRLTGIIKAKELEAVAPELWAQLTVGEVMKPIEKLPWASPETSAKKILEVMSQEQVSHLPVISEGQLLGIISADNFLQLITTRRESGPKIGRNNTDATTQSQPKEVRNKIPLSGKLSGPLSGL